MTTSGFTELPSSNAELEAIAQDVVDRRSRSYVADALTLSRYVLEIRALARRVAAGEAPVLELLDRLR